jgi:hypothetical protein
VIFVESSINFLSAIIGFYANARMVNIALHQNAHEALKNEQDRYKKIPVVRKLDIAIIQRNYLQIKQDVQNILLIQKWNACWQMRGYLLIK